MRLEGKTLIAAPREKVWEFLTDATAVARCVPGLESVEVVVPDRKFRALAAVGLGSVKTRFATEVEWLDLDKPTRACMKAHGMAPGGAADATAEMTLADAPDGSTELAWTAEVSVAGTIASLAARVLGGISKKITGAFFARVRKEVETGGRSGRRGKRRRKQKV